MGSKEARMAIEDLTFVNALTRLASLGRQVTFLGLRLTGKAWNFELACGLHN